MRGTILKCAVGVAPAAMPARAAPLAPEATVIDLGASSPVEHVRDHCGRGWHRTRWRDHGVIGIGVTAFQTKAPTAAGAARVVPSLLGLAWSCPVGLKFSIVSDLRAEPSLTADPIGSRSCMPANLSPKIQRVLAALPLSEPRAIGHV
jgi:hypothetical protein